MTRADEDAAAQAGVRAVLSMLRGEWLSAAADLADAVLAILGLDAAREHLDAAAVRRANQLADEAEDREFDAQGKLK